MTQRSRFWNGLATGDATEAPYDADTEFADVLAALAGTGGLTNQGAVVRTGGRLGIGQLAVTGAVSPVSIDKGEALITGTWFSNDAAVTQAITTPAVSTRYDLIGLQKSWVSQTVRIFYRAGTEGNDEAAALALAVQNFGTTWEMPLAAIRINTSGDITIYDNRQFTPTDGVLYEDTVVASVASIDIPISTPFLAGLGYNSLELILRARTNGTPAAFDDVHLRFNADSGLNYDYSVISGDSGSAGVVSIGLSQGVDSVRLGYVANAVHGAGVYGTTRVLLSHVLSATALKGVLSTSGVVDTDASGTRHGTSIINGMWESLAALTSINLSPVAGTFFSIGTYVCLRGLPS